MKCYTKKCLPKTIINVKNMFMREEIVIDDTYQRGYVWKKDQQIKLIDSLIRDIDIPPVYASYDTETKKYSIIDGQQRLKTINRFANNEFTLENVDLFEIDGVEYDLNGMTYSDIQQKYATSEEDDNPFIRIKSKTLNLYYYDDMDYEDQVEMFQRHNNGTDMSTIDMLRVELKSKKEFSELSKHEIFSDIMSEDSINKSNNFGFVLNCYMMQYGNKAVSTKEIRKNLLDTELTEEQVNEMKETFNLYKEVLDECCNIKKSLFNTVKKKTHFASIFPLVKIAKDENIKAIFVAEFLSSFFIDGKNNEDDFYTNYIESSTDGSGKQAAGESRYNMLLEAWNKYIKDTSVNLSEESENSVVA